MKDFGVQENVSLDLGILRGFSYYTGAVFEGYVPGMGFPVVEGGRYDALYADFGAPLPATGFAIHLGNLLEQFPLPAVEGADVLVYGSDDEQIIRQCQTLRAKGKRVEMALGITEDEVAQKVALVKRIPELICVE